MRKAPIEGKVGYTRFCLDFRVGGWASLRPFKNARCAVELSVNYSTMTELFAVGRLQFRVRFLAEKRDFAAVVQSGQDGAQAPGVVGVTSPPNVKKASTGFEEDMLTLQPLNPENIKTQKTSELYYTAVLQTPPRLDFLSSH